MLLLLTLIIAILNCSRAVVIFFLNAGGMFYSMKEAIGLTSTKPKCSFRVYKEGFP